MKKTIILLIVGLGILVLVQDFLASKKKAQPISPRPYIVLLSLDGFRWDYQAKAPTPNLDSITRHGAKAIGLQPCFPSKTIPNLYSIATGLYPGNHELISNNFYAPDLKQFYSINDRKTVENKEFYKGEPIWVTAEAQRLKTATLFWVGSEAQIKGYQPTYWKRYNHVFPYNQRVDTVISWLSKPYKERPKLVTWYLDEADTDSHRFGPENERIKQSIMSIDSMIGYFLNKSQTLEIKDSINLIIVSDHGMQAIDTTKIVNISHLKANWTDTVIGDNSMALIYPKKDCKDSILNSLKNIEGISAWAKKDIPEQFHLKQSKRVSDILVVAKNGWNIKLNNKKLNSSGTHGYNNNIPEMNGVFYAVGPNIKSAYNAGQLYNVDIYNLITEILKIKPAPNDGKKERIFHILKE